MSEEKKGTVAKIARREGVRKEGERGRSGKRMREGKE